MDELAEAFSEGVGVSFSADSSAVQHPRMCMYKARETKQSQWERRKRKLHEQREKRKDYSNTARKLAEEDYANITLSDDEDGMDQSSPASKQKGKKPKRERYYSNQLMLSEWLDDVPEDLAENWLMVPCPVGRRTFLLASMGQTRHYTKGGYLINNFQCRLPGGSFNQSKKSTSYTILDCIYSEVTHTYWVLDLMCWQGHPVYDSDTEFRFFWLQSKFSENPELSSRTKKNPIKFCPLPAFRCDKQTLQDAMAKQMPFQDELDGLLFYHKELHYVPGVTPLIGWLKPWMMPEILSIPIPKSLADKRPRGASLRPPPSSSSASSTSPVPANPNAKKASKGKTDGSSAKAKKGANEKMEVSSKASNEKMEVSSKASKKKKGGSSKASSEKMEVSSKASSEKMEMSSPSSEPAGAEPSPATAEQTESAMEAEASNTGGEPEKGAVA